MTTVVEAKRVVITPTAWKWYAGAAAFTVLAFTGAGAAMLAPAAFLALTGTGLVNRIVLDTEGFEYRSYSTRRRYAWSEVSDFRLQVYRVNLFASVKMITFTEVAKRDTFFGKFSRAFAGGTQSMPVVGIAPRKLLELIAVYSGQGAQAAPTPAVPPERIKTGSDRATPPARRPAPAFAFAAPMAREKPVQLIVDSRSRARQTRDWPNS